MVGEATVFVKHVNYCSWFSQGFLLQFLLYPGGLDSCLPHFGCWACVSELTVVFIRQRKDGRALGLTRMTKTDWLSKRNQNSHDKTLPPIVYQFWVRHSVCHEDNKRTWYPWLCLRCLFTSKICFKIHVKTYKYFFS